ncbi:aspartate ammonia-lyase [Alcaligenes sp. 13f]|uniref:aspartate ammonia-lyase n=1 Tax=Alcaligenes sp. 13f TaxID=2841924 RepID=UPI001CF6E707|nr:aspartate ammonia-lyase [Alcaligenes sp. 13f]MCB4321984.1 aspartate ammonia-lyase [Alcaligenes sp. 13f]
MDNNHLRLEKDSLGSRLVPVDVYWGAQTSRAIENFPISSNNISSMCSLVKGLAYVKKAAAVANLELGILSHHKASAILKACDDILAGELQNQFVVDVFQGGAGTSTNMNVNEVIANRALEHMGLEFGDYSKLHPNDDVNASQSTNDVYPTALRLAIWSEIGGFLESLEVLRTTFESKAVEFDAILKIGRTQLQDAVPMTLGQEFRAFAVLLEDDKLLLQSVREMLTHVNLGGTAIGTGVNAPAKFKDLVIPILAQLSGVPVVSASNLIAATQDTGVFVLLSGVLKRVASKLSKFSNDLRLLSSGPQAGMGDIFLPARQAGSSIMPGKVNPVIPEAVNQVAFEVIGNDVTITMAAEAGQLQLNAFEPIIGWSLFKSIEHLSNACKILAINCVQDIRPNNSVLSSRVENSVTVVTALNPIIGYDKACAIAKAALESGDNIADTAERLGIMGAEEVMALLVPENLTQAPKIPAGN